MRPSAEIEQDLEEARTARMALAKGERVEEVQRGLDRRNLRLATVTIPQLTTLIRTLQTELEDALELETGGRARRPIGLRW